MFHLTLKELMSFIFFVKFRNIADEIFVSFDQAMQTGQIADFDQFASTILHWVENSCRPSVKTNP